MKHPTGNRVQKPLGWAWKCKRPTFPPLGSEVSNCLVPNSCLPLSLCPKPTAGREGTEHAGAAWALRLGASRTFEKQLRTPGDRWGVASLRVSFLPGMHFGGRFQPLCGTQAWTGVHVLRGAVPFGQLVFRPSRATREVPGLAPGSKRASGRGQYSFTTRSGWGGRKWGWSTLEKLVLGSLEK